MRAVVHFQPFRHQIVQHLVYGVCVIDVTVYFGWRNVALIVAFYHLHGFLILEYSLHLLTLLFGELAR